MWYTMWYKPQSGPSHIRLRLSVGYARRADDIGEALRSVADLAVEFSIVVRVGPKWPAPTTPQIR